MNIPDIAAHAEAVKTQGYTIIRNQLDARQLEALNAAAGRALDAVGVALQQGIKPAHTQLNQFYRSVRCFYTWDAAARGLLEHDSIKALARQVLGEARLWDMTVLEALPMPPEAELGPFNWHRDFSASAEDERHGYLWVFCCLTDVTSDNGATWVIPASHRDPNMERPAQAKADQPKPANAVQLTAKAGDLVVINPVAYHCVGENRTSQGRRLALVGMCRHDRAPLLNHWAIAGPALQRALPPQSQAFLRTSDTTLAGSWDVLPEGWVVSRPNFVKRTVGRLVQKARALSAPGRLWRNLHRQPAR